MSEKNDLPRGWCWATIDEIAQIQGGIQKQPKRTPRQNAFPYLRVANVLRGRLDLSEIERMELFGNELETLRLQSGDLLIVEGNGSVTEIGRSAVWNGQIPDCVHQNHIIRVRLLGGCPEYMDYFWNSPSGTRQVMSVASSTSGLYTLSVRKVAGMRVPLAPEAEQHRIVAAIEQQFTRLDAGVATLRRVQAALKRYRAAVLKAAVEGKLTEAWRAEHPGVEPASALLARILAERRARWESDLRAKGKDPAKTRYEEPEEPNTAYLPELPEGWCWTSLGQCFRVEVGATPSRAQSTYWGGDIPWASSGEVQFCRIRETREHITQVGLANSSTQINPAGSVLLGMIGEGRTRGQVAILDIDACNNQNCAAIWVSQTSVVPEFVYYWLWSQYEVTRRRGSGNNQPALNKSRVEEMVFPLPPLDEQQQIVAEAEERLSVVSELEATVKANLKRAERLRQSILERAFSGQLVPQDPNDEPASALLERIRRGREYDRSASVGLQRRLGTGQGEREIEGVGAAAPQQASMWDDA